VELGIGVVWEHYQQGTTLYGADAHLGAWLAHRVEMEVRAGLRAGPTAMASDGVVQPSALSTGVGAFFALGPLPARWGLDAAGRFDVEHLSFTPAPRGAASARSASEFAFVSSFGPRGWFAPTPAVRVGLELLGDLPLRGVDATDGGAHVTGVDGFGWTVHIHLSSVL
jgi:hypothetical protein